MSNMQSQKSNYKTETQSVEELEDIELKADLFRYQIDGYSAWRLLRFKMAGILQSLPFSSPLTSFGWSWVVERLSYIFKEIPIFISPQRKDVVIKTVSTALSEVDSYGFYKDIYFDDLIDNADKCIKIETLNNPAYAKRRKNALIPAAMTTALIDLVSAALSFIRIPMHTRPLAGAIYNDIRTEFTGLALTPKDIQLSLLRFYWSKRLYKHLFSRIKPKITLSADPGQFAFWAASRELGIPTVELQHGVFTRKHPNALNSTMNAYRKSLIAPNKILLFGEYWKQQLLLNHYYQEELVAVGSPRIDRYRKIRKEILNANNHGRETIILLTSQGLDLERLVAFIREFTDAANSKIQYILYIKLHPAERENGTYVQGLQEYPQIKILYGFESPSTFELMVNADLHISIASASHYDALGLFVPTAVLPLAGHEIVQNLVDAGHAHALSTPHDLVDLALNIHQHKVSREVSYYYYEPDAIKNIKREIDFLVK